MTTYAGEYIMTVEGAVPTKDGGIYCTIVGRTALEIVKEAAAGVKAISPWRSCALSTPSIPASPTPSISTIRQANTSSMIGGWKFIEKSSKSE